MRAVSRSPIKRRDSRSVSSRGRDAAARRGGLRHRPARSPGVRPPGRRARPRRRPGNGAARRDRRPGGRSDPAGIRRCARAGDRHSVRLDGHPAARGAIQPRTIRGRDDRGDSRNLPGGRGAGSRRRPCRMVSRHNRLLVAFYVLSDALLGVSAFIFAYGLRFHTELVQLIPITKGLPPLRQYINVLPFVAVLVPLGFQLQGLYRLRRGRSRVDDFFAVFVGSILAVVFGIFAMLYVQTYFATATVRERGQLEVSQPVWAIFLVLNVALTFASRELVRDVLERRWRAGIGLKRILIAGSGELGRLVADKILEHRELGYQIVGFVDDKASGDHLGYRGLPLLGTIEEASEIATREAIDHLYVALPPEQHVQMLQLIDSTSREFVDVKVVPDLLQVIALRARLEDLDGVPVININDVPLQGFNSLIKRGLDIVISATALVVLAIPFWVIAAL